jgi:hypothetical protein
MDELLGRQRVELGDPDVLVPGKQRLGIGFDLPGDPQHRHGIHHDVGRWGISAAHGDDGARLTVVLPAADASLSGLWVHDHVGL